MPDGIKSSLCWRAKADLISAPYVTGRKRLKELHHGTKIGDRECMQYICQRLKSTFPKKIRLDLTVKVYLKS